MTSSKRFEGGRVVAAVFVSCSILLFTPAREAEAHAPLDRQIADLTKRIQADPLNAGLFLRRGEVHRAHRDWASALRDYETARRLSPGMRAVDLCMGQMLLQAGRAERALACLDRFLEQDSSHQEARAERGRALVILGAPLEASLDFSSAVESACRQGTERPEYYLERALALAAAGGEHLEEALRGLEEGLARLGPLVTLELAAVDLELSLGRPSAAIERLARMAARTPRKESFLFRRGEILEREGRIDEACAAYQAALEAVEHLPPSKQKTRAMERLRQNLAGALERINRTDLTDANSRKGRKPR